MPTDVTDEDAVADLVDATVALFGGIDVAVHNAGVGERGRDVLPDAGGAPVRPRDRRAPDIRRELRRPAAAGVRSRYAASKWWMRGFAESVSSQVGEADVGVTVANPAAVRTEFDADGQSMAERYGPGEAVEPAEVAETIAFAAERSPSMVHEVNVYTRDKLGGI